MPSAQSYESLVRMSADEAKTHFNTDKFILRLYDGGENRWIDVRDEIPWDEAVAALRANTKEGTEYARYEHGSYYSIFPERTRMLYR